MYCTKEVVIYMFLKYGYMTIMYSFYCTVIYTEIQEEHIMSGEG